MTDRNWEREAAQYIEALKTIAAKPENLNTLQYYLGIHFDTWLKRWASTPEAMISELRTFAEMEI